jgi:hypothetical protein
MEIAGGGLGFLLAEARGREGFFAAIVFACGLVLFFGGEAGFLRGMHSPGEARLNLLFGAVRPYDPVGGL